MASGDLPSRIGEFEIVRRIGSGGFGVVYLATDHRLGRNIAVKLAHPGRGDLWREARVAARLAHPNVVTIFELGEHAGAPYIAMEFVDGPTLRERLAEGRLPYATALRIARELAAAVAAAHREGVVHLDLSPANVLLANDGRARVVDFGLARRAADVDPVGHAGTPSFMAPEQWRGEPVGPPADVWALGAMICVLVAGSAPVDGAAARIRERVASPAELDLPVALAEMPGELAAIVQRCLRKDPSARPLADEIGNALEALQPTTGPFRGREPFDATSAAIFHGRGDEVTAVLELVRRERTIAIVGDGGVGKTSLVHAGVIPSLRNDGWKVVVVRPGRRPLEAIASALRATLPGAVTETLQNSLDRDRDVAGQVARWSAAPGRFAAELADASAAVAEKLALVIDQLEELESIADPEARDPTAAALAAAITDDSALRIIVVTRSEDHARLTARLGSLGIAIAVAAPSHAQLTSIFEQTLGDASYRADPGLASRIADDVVDTPRALERLQLIGIELWERRDRERRQVTLASYCELAAATAGESPDGSAKLLSLRPALTKWRVSRLGRWLAVGAGAVATGAVLFALAGRARDRPAAGGGPSQCSARSYPDHELATVFNVPHLQDAVAGVSSDGRTIVSYRRDCAHARFLSLLIDEVFEGVALTFDLRRVPALANAFHSDGHMTITGDGLTVIAVDEARTGFVAATRSERGTSAFVAEHELVAAIRYQAPVRVVTPAISPDGLALYFTINSSGDPKRDGIYETVRSSLAQPFPPATRMDDVVNFGTDYVTGVSEDRLAIFIQSAYLVGIYTRSSLADPFRNPNFPVGPPLAPGFRARPFAGCTKVIATCVSGCNGEDSCVYTQQQ